MTHLVALSGGPDSAWCLKHVLETTNDRVIGLHVSLVDGTRRHEMELFACKMIESYARKHLRPFELRLATMQAWHGATYYDWPVVAQFVGMVLASDEGITDVWNGTVREDEGSKERDAMGERIAKWSASLWTPDAKSVRFHFAPGTLSKAEVRAYLGEELWGLTWSCRYPTPRNEPCGECVACKRRNESA